uniref:Uncharacterized protein n=1 Tax=Aegilops tauschii subsp. strangulata TaxID=200361 RepID=A0A453T1G6_AEGTS
MVVNHADKENLLPSTAAIAHTHGVVLRSCKLKRLGRAQWRVPLRDITNLFVVESVVAEWRQALIQQPRYEGSAAAELAVKNGPAGGVALKPGRYLLRKEYF